MNYGKKGIHKIQKSLTSKSIKFQKMFFVTVFRLLILAIISAGVIGACFAVGVFKGILSAAPDIDPASVLPMGFASVMYDAEGNEMTKLVAANSNRSQEDMSKIPQNLADAFVAIEDERFYSHNGIDIKGILRAGLAVFESGELSQGASTITQQLIKNNVFDNWTNESDIQKIKRKIQEQYLAVELEKKMSKEDILEAYMNTINLSQNTLGVKAAARRYFNKETYQLTLSECAVIAAITQRPTALNPISNPEANAKRRKDVLDKMKELEFITQAEYDEAMADDVYSRIAETNAEVSTNSVYTYFEDAVTEQVFNDLMEIKGYNESQAYNVLYSGGLSIFTTQDPKIQSICDDIYNNEENFPANSKWQLSYALTIEKPDGTKENHSSEMFRSYFRQFNSNFNMIYSTQEDAYAAIEEYKAAVMSEGDKVDGENVSLVIQPQVSLVVEDQSTGHIVAMIGGRGTKSASRTLNRATNTVRQPGSTFKVLSTYAPALDSAGQTLASVQNDAPFTYSNGRPVRNHWGSTYRGLLSYRYAIQWSANVVTVKALTQITPQLGFDYLQNFGFTSLVERRVESDGTIVSDIGQPLALGGITDGVSNLELNAAYAAIANGGTYIKPKLYTKVIDHDGNVLIDNTQPITSQVIKPTTAWLLTSAMKDVITSGTGSRCNFPNMAIAGKSGTTTSSKDVWFSGYTPYYTATTWTGFDNNEKLTKGEEQNLSKTLWREVMSQIHADLEYKDFTMPSGIVTATVCSKSGRLPIAGICDGCTTTEYFAEGTVPTEYCDVHVYSNICAYSGLTATEECPFKQASIVENIPTRLEDASLASVLTNQTGDTSDETTDDDEDELLAGQLPIDDTTQLCPHNSTFMSAPNAQDILLQQAAELQMRQAAELAGQTQNDTPPPSDT